MQVVSDGAETVAAGNQHSVMLKVDGSVWAAGCNLYGQLGDGSTRNSYLFVLVMSDGVRKVAAGAFHSMALKRDGSIWATGWNKFGQHSGYVAQVEEIFAEVFPFEDGC